MKLSSIGKTIAMLVTVIAVFAMTLVTGPRKAEAAVISDNIITSASVETTPLYGVQGSTVNLTMNFDLPNNTIKSGDTSVIQLPAGFTFAWSLGFDVKDSSGAVVAHAEANSATRTITLTYTDYPEKHSDVHGEIVAAIRAQYESDTNYGHRGITLTVGDKNVVPVDGQIDYQRWGGDNPNEILAKWAHLQPRTNQIIYTIRVNARRDNLSNVTITDTISTEGVHYFRTGTDMKDGITFTRGVMQRDPTSGSFYMTNERDITDDVRSSLQFNAANNSFTVNLGNLGTDSVEIVYAVNLDRELLQGEAVDNDVVMTSTTPSGDQNFHSRVLWETASGQANGYNYAINVKKTDKNGAALQGAEFTVTCNRTGEVVGTLTTDASGEATLGSLLRDDYTLTETKAPTGYKLADPVKIKGGQFDLTSRSVLVTVQDEAEPVVTPPTPTTPTTSTPKNPSKSDKKVATAEKRELGRTGADIAVIAGGATALVALGAAAFALRVRREKKA